MINKRTTVTVSFTLPSTPDPTLTDDDLYTIAMEYTSAMFAAIDYPNEVGSEWYIESVETEETE